MTKYLIKCNTHLDDTAMSYRTEKSIVKADVRERPIRKSVHLPAKVIVGVKTYPGFLINISAKGIGMFVINTTFPECTINCTKGTVLKLVVESTLGVFVTLQCRIKWLRIKKCSSK